MNATRLVPIALLLAAYACTGDATVPVNGGSAGPGVLGAPVVYGADDRSEWHSFPDEAVRALTRDAAAAMVPTGSVAVRPDGTVQISSSPLGSVHGLCADQAFRDQPTIGSCSGTLIDDDLILTAGHCVDSRSACGGNLWVFDYLYEAPDELAPLAADAVYRCVDIVAHGAWDHADDIDFAVIQLDRPVIGRAPAPVATPGSVASGDPLIMAGFPNGVPLKIDAGGVVAAPRAGQGDYFIASVDAFHGSSGSGVLDRDLRVVGVLTDGADDYEDVGSCNVVSVLDPDDAEESVVYAHHAVTTLCDKGFPSQALCGVGEAICGDGFCTGETSDDCPADCDGIFAVPAEWTCNPAWYDVGDDCDCACGAWDPDCDQPQLDLLNCASGSVCLPDGACSVAVPETWTCRTSWYGDGRDCDCDCGAPDPDCDAASALDPDNCAPGGVCREDGTCTVSIPEGWRCRTRYYGSDDGCDCGCGAPDPDCDRPGAVVSGCAPGSACLPDGTCEAPIPAAWICPAAYYGVADDCDCNCGAPDPDCEQPSLRLLNCPEGAVCDAAGACAEPDVEPPVEAEPEADVVEADVAELSPDTAEPDTGSPETSTDDGDGQQALDVPRDAGGDAAQAVAGRDDGGCAGGAVPAWPAALLGLLWLPIARRRRRV